jgi:hypothetical protein
MIVGVVKNSLVTNVIEADSVDSIKDLFDGFELILETLESNMAWIGARVYGNKFEPIRVFESWNWNESEFTYEPPTPKPDGNYYWNEAELDWLVIPEPEPAPE